MDKPKVTIHTEPPKLLATAKEITNLMNKLGCTRWEAIDIIRADRQIDKMTVAEATADLTKEQKQAVKNATIAHTRERKPAKRERKIDSVKQKFIKGIKIFLEGCGAKVEPLTNETDLHFTFENAHYSIKLTKHRPPKKQAGFAPLMR